MTNKEHVLKYGGKFSISDGEVRIMPDRHDVHFALDPEMGYCGANIAVGFHKPGKEFTPHKYPISKEILIIHSGKGECYLYNKWIPVKTRNIVFAPPGVLHDTRNPAENTEDFVMLGIAAPPQLGLYLHAGYDILKDNSGEYVGEVQREKWRKEKCSLIHIMKC